MDAEWEGKITLNVLLLGTETNHSELIHKATGSKFLCSSVHSVSVC